jgi:ABC-2 type transport system ATP-binding protein
VSPAVEVVDLVKLFSRRDRTRRALDGVSLTVARGECVAVLGQNGSGKSTLVRVLATLLLHEQGQVRVFGHDVAREEKAVRRLVNRVSVEASFFKRMSAGENLSYSARFYGLTPKNTRAQVPEILDAVGFPAKRAKDPMEDLSRGMQQKVALARALLTSPTLLLLDEPTTGLGPSSRCASSSPACAARTTPRRCCARTTWRRRTRSPIASASSTRAACSRSTSPRSCAPATARRRSRTRS